VGVRRSSTIGFGDYGIDNVANQACRAAASDGMKRPQGDTGVAEREAVNRVPRDAYWVLRGPRKECFVCARFGKDELAALCVFDSETNAEEYLRSLSETQMFLNTLEMYGIFTPSWVSREALLPAACEMSRRKLWEAIQEIGVGFVAINPPPEGVEEETFELQPSANFEA
jgi:hypothetical protein